ncbi:unnamed protein product [Amoebophrya sp. A25]|nr:unnamed protein product [Amoebophrya sp. A25]|eukprot:GSA25T00019864001.1
MEKISVVYVHVLVQRPLENCTSERPQLPQFLLDHNIFLHQ